MRPVCVHCQLFMAPKRNGVLVEEGQPDHENPNPGAPFKPYRLWSADLFRCSQCGSEVITNFARNPLAEHFQSNYPELARQALLRTQN